MFMDCWLWNRSQCPLQQLTRRNEWQSEGGRERRDYFQFIQHNSATWVKKQTLWSFYQPERRASLRCGSRASDNSIHRGGGVKDGVTDQRATLYTDANEILCLSLFGKIDRCCCLCCGAAVTQYMGWELLCNGYRRRDTISCDVLCLRSMFLLLIFSSVFVVIWAKQILPST